MRQYQFVLVWNAALWRCLKVLSPYTLTERNSSKKISQLTKDLFPYSMVLTQKHHHLGNLLNFKVPTSLGAIYSKLNLF